MNQCYQTSKKNKKIDGKVLIDVCLLQDGVRLWMSEEIKAIQLVVVGGDVGNPGLERPFPITEDELPWQCLIVCAGDLKIVDTENTDRGLVFCGEKQVPIFIRIPRKVSLSITGVETLAISTRYC